MQKKRFFDGQRPSECDVRDVFQHDLRQMRVGDIRVARTDGRDAVGLIDEHLLKKIARVAGIGKALRYSRQNNGIF